MIVVRVVAFGLGVALAAFTVLSAVRTFVVPRALPVALSRAVFLATGGLFGLATRRARSYHALDRVMAMYAPVTLLMLPFVWLALLVVAYAAMFWALGDEPWRAVEVSGSSLLTLGFERPGPRPAVLLSFTEAALGVGMIALLLTFLPTIYAAFSRREELVSLLEVRAGTPPSAVAMLERYHRIDMLDRADDLWERAEAWFAHLSETHTSLAALAFFRSPHPDHSWVTAAGAILDAAALRQAVLDLPWSPDAALCIRSGFLALRRIGDFFSIPYDHDPAPDDPISIGRDEFDAACDRLAAAGAPMKPDRDQAWRDFVGWRVNYDTVLLALAGLTLAPEAPWSSDRSTGFRSPPLTRRGRQARDAGG